MARSRHGRRTPANPAVAALQRVWASVLSLLFIVAGLALMFVGAVFAYVGAQAVLTPEDAWHVIAGVLFAVVGLAAVAGGALLVWRRQRLAARLSSREHRSKKRSTGSGYVGGSFFGGSGGGDCGGGGGGGGDGGGSC